MAYLYCRLVFFILLAFFPFLAFVTIATQRRAGPASAADISGDELTAFACGMLRAQQRQALTSGCDKFAVVGTP